MSFDFVWRYRTVTYDNTLKVFFEAVECDGVKLFISYDHGRLEGIHTLDGQDITSIVDIDVYSGFEQKVKEEAEA